MNPEPIDRWSWRSQPKRFVVTLVVVALVAFLLGAGGGYVIGSPEGHRELVAHLAVQAEARVLAVDYRLGPEHVFPAAQEDCIASYRWLLAQGTDPGRVAVAGDSAGGALALAVLQQARNAGDPP